MAERTAATAGVEDAAREDAAAAVQDDEDEAAPLVFWRLASEGAMVFRMRFIFLGKSKKALYISFFGPSSGHRTFRPEGAF